jgi:hypothetical protein
MSMKSLMLRIGGHDRFKECEDHLRNESERLADHERASEWPYSTRPAVEYGH